MEEAFAMDTSKLNASIGNAISRLFPTVAKSLTEIVSQEGVQQGVKNRV